MTLNRRETTIQKYAGKLSENEFKVDWQPKQSSQIKINHYTFHRNKNQEKFFFFLFLVSGACVILARIVVVEKKGRK